jgi:signal peptidase II
VQTARVPHPLQTPRGRAVLQAGIVLAVVVIADQVVKALIRHDVAVGEQHRVVGGVVKIVHVRNDGVAFGAFSGGGAIVVVLVVAALAALVYYFATHAQQRLVWLPTGLLLGGALGNILDRVFHGEVTDFIKLPHWPAFNVADVAITFGVVALLWAIEQGDRRAAEHRPR